MSVSLGTRGARFTIGPRGTRTTFGIPGTGIYYTVHHGARRPSRSSQKQREEIASLLVPRPEERLKLSFLQRLWTPKDVENLVDGAREALLGHHNKAYELLVQAAHLPDAAFLTGFLALEKNQLDQAEQLLRYAAAKHRQLGYLQKRYGVVPSLELPITDEITAHLPMNLRGTLLGLVEVLQRQGKDQEALAQLERLFRLEPEDPLVKLSLAELLWQTQPDDPHTWKRILRLAQGIQNDSPIHAALLLYQARALRKLGLLEAARDVLTRLLRKKKSLPDSLRKAIQYERALVYESLGQHRRARREWEKLYLVDPHFQDVAARCGMTEDSTASE